MLASLTPQQLEAYKALPEKERRAMTAELMASRSEEYVEQLRAYRNTSKSEVRDVTWENNRKDWKGASLARCGMENNPINQVNHRSPKSKRWLSENVCLMKSPQKSSWKWEMSYSPPFINTTLIYKLVIPSQIAFFLFAKEISQTQENKMVRKI